MNEPISVVLGLENNGGREQDGPRQNVEMEHLVERRLSRSQAWIASLTSILAAGLRPVPLRSVGGVLESTQTYSSSDSSSSLGRATSSSSCFLLRLDIVFCEVGVSIGLYKWYKA